MNISVIVIGAGPAGIEAATTAALCGAHATLIDSGPPGGRATHGSLLPSKVWLGEARPGATPASILESVASVKQSWMAACRRRLDAAGVTCIQGRAQLVGPGRVMVEGSKQPLAAEVIVLACGSEPVFEPALKPDGKQVIAPRHLSMLQQLPRRMVVIGAGATGCEMVHLFNAMGVEVTWLTGTGDMLPGFVREAADMLAAAMAGRGVEIVPDARACDIERRRHEVVVIDHRGRRHAADQVFVATGRRADLDGQGLESLGLDSSAPVDAHGCIRPGLYWIGDAAGTPFLANRALAQARIAVRHALGLAVDPYAPNHVVQAVYSQPEVAQVGRVQGAGIQTQVIGLDQALKSHLLDPHGKFALCWDERGRITGGWVVGRHASEALAPVVTAIAAGANLAQLAAAYPANPTLGELAAMAARVAEDTGRPSHGVA